MARSSEPVGVGIVGAGIISTIYLENLTNVFDNVRVIAVADLVMEKAREQAERFGAEAMTVEELIAHPDIEIVVNLTIPAAHADVAIAALEAGKHVYNEKPLAVTREDARRILDVANERSLLVGCAPDTFLGAGYQTARALVDQGVIGEPHAAAAHMLQSGRELWHPNPDFYYQPGGGPMFVMGPYYVAGLISVLGPVARVASSAGPSWPTRTIATGPRAGEKIPVITPTHIIALLDFARGTRASLTTTFDVFDTAYSSVVLYGPEGTLRLPDPNHFGGRIELLRAGATEWEPVPLIDGHTSDSRGIGVSDLAAAVREGRSPRASGEFAYHVLDVLHATIEASEQERYIHLETSFTQPEPLGPFIG